MQGMKHLTQQSKGHMRLRKETVRADASVAFNGLKLLRLLTNKVSELLLLPGFLHGHSFRAVVNAICMMTTSCHWYKCSPEADDVITKQGHNSMGCIVSPLF